MYAVRIKTHFKRSLEKLTKRDEALKNRIESKVRDLSRAPYSESKTLTAGLKGKRSTYVGREYRIICSICEECRQMGYKRFNRCPDCEEIPDKSIILWDVDKREIVYE
ncbi:MAG: hypothetical protein AOA66_1374 [Candidatus Bathyarchaeota archaeon BA2]|nr:MAG: hypothetical protein AOA66_1374 [Candidatus Bathyarchaeota archaeon BA2]